MLHFNEHLPEITTVTLDDNPIFAVLSRYDNSVMKAIF